MTPVFTVKMVLPDASTRLFPEDHAVEILASRCGREVLQVLDDDQRRWLKFRHGALQSAMNKQQPERLVLPYTRAMASALLFVDNPAHVLILGLGGGSLVRFYLHHYPGTRLTVVEQEPTCVMIAHELFSVPRDHPNVEVITGDARDVVPRLTDRYDMIMLDLFLSHGPPTWLDVADFFDACREQMSDEAVLSANLWAGPNDQDLACLRGVSAAFQGRLLMVPVSGYRNIIALAFPDGYESPDLSSLRARARRLSRHTQFDAQSFLRAIETTNRVEETRLLV